MYLRNWKKFQSGCVSFWVKSEKRKGKFGRKIEKGLWGVQWAHGVDRDCKANTCDADRRDLRADKI